MKINNIFQIFKNLMSPFCKVIKIIKAKAKSFIKMLILNKLTLLLIIIKIKNSN